MGSSIFPGYRLSKLSLCSLHSICLGIVSSSKVSANSDMLIENLIHLSKNLPAAWKILLYASKILHNITLWHKNVRLHILYAQEKPLCPGRLKSGRDVCKER